MKKILCLSALLAGFSAPALAQTMTVATVADVLQFDPTDIGDEVTSYVVQNVYEHLVARSNKGEYIPALAVSWKNEGKSWTFKLRPNVKFHDGSAFNASVVKWHFERVLKDPAAPVRYRKQFGEIIKSIDVIDPLTVRFNMLKPNAAFLDLVITSNGGFIISKANAEKVGASGIAKTMIGTGAFKFKRWVTGQRVELEANKEYWGFKPKITSLNFRPIPESNTQVIELQTGGVQLITKIGQEDVKTIQADKNLRLAATPAYKVRFLNLNASKAPLNDIKVRKALHYALDIPTIVGALVGELATPSQHGIVPNASWAKPSQSVWKVYPYDTSKALALLADAGWKNQGGKLMKDGTQLQLNMYTPNGRYFMDKEISEVIRNQLGRLGINVKLTVLEWGPYQEMLKGGQYDMAFLGWNQSTGEPSIFTDPLTNTSGRANYSKLSDKQLDALLDQAVAVTSKASRQKVYTKVLDRITDLAWYLPLYNEYKLAATPVKLKGFVLSPSTTDMRTVYFSK